MPIMMNPVFGKSGRKSFEMPVIHRRKRQQNQARIGRVAAKSLVVLPMNKEGYHEKPKTNQTNTAYD